MKIKINDAFSDKGFTFREGVFLVVVLVASGIETFLSNWLGLLVPACIGATVTVVALMVAGAALPSLIFKNKSHALSRQKAAATPANKKHFKTK